MKRSTTPAVTGEVVTAFLIFWLWEARSSARRSIRFLPSRMPSVDTSDARSANCPDSNLGS